MTVHKLSLKTRHYRWYPPNDHLGYQETTSDVDGSRTGLLLVDVYLPEKFDPEDLEADQNSRLSEEDYALWRATLEEHIAPVLSAAREVDLPIIYTCNQNFGIAHQHSQYSRKISQSLGFEVEDSFKTLVTGDHPLDSAVDALHFIEEIAPQPGDFFVGKTVYSGFFNTPLDSLLRNLNLDTLIVVGFRLDACLLGTVLDALYRNYRVILVRDATLACELPHEMDEKRFTQRMVLHFEALIGETMTGENFISACEKEQLS
jgi:nicotinamidase-related amidase